MPSNSHLTCCLILDLSGEEEVLSEGGGESLGENDMPVGSRHGGGDAGPEDGSGNDDNFDDYVSEGSFNSYSEDSDVSDEEGDQDGKGIDETTALGSENATEEGGKGQKPSEKKKEKKMAKRKEKEKSSSSSKRKASDK